MQKPLVDRPIGPPRQTLFETNVQIARDRIGLRLWRQSDALCVLERRLVRSDEVALTQILLIEGRQVRNCLLVRFAELFDGTRSRAGGSEIPVPLSAATQIVRSAHAVQERLPCPPT